jgi:MFS family permease
MQPPEIRKHVRHNFTVNVIDAGFFGLGAIGLASAVTVIPLFLNSLGASEVLITLIGSIHGIGWQLPQIFTANRVAGLQRFKPMVMFMTVHERWPFFGLAIVALLMQRLEANLIIALAFVMLSIYAIGGGLAATAWQSMIGKIIPAEKRGTFFGTQSAVANLTGAVGALLAGFLLQELPSPLDFTLCFFLTGITMMISLWFLGRTREPAHERTSAIVDSHRASWKKMGQILQRDTNFRWYLLARILSSFAWVSITLYSIYMYRAFNVSEAVIGIMTGVMTLSQTVANPIFGWLGDRLGHRSMFVIGALMMAGSTAMALFATDVSWFYIAFGLAGAANATLWAVAITFTLEFGEDQEKPLYIGLANTPIAIASLAAAFVGGTIAGQFGFQATFLLSLIAGLLMAMVLQFAVYDPRFGKSNLKPQLTPVEG